MMRVRWPWSHTCVLAGEVEGTVTALERTSTQRHSNFGIAFDLKLKFNRFVLFMWVLF